jgi:pimeloyl-ACP methyl ester carboxylesterase
MAQQSTIRREAAFFDVGAARLEGDLEVPSGATGVVVFVHGSGSSRHSPRNRRVAQFLGQSGLATLLFDLLTPAEERADERTGHLRFDIALLSERLVSVIDSVRQRADIGTLPVGLFGASTGGAAALVAASERPEAIAAVVSRGGRPDLAGTALGAVRAPTLLIVGGHDPQVIELNRWALARLPGSASLEIVPGATHLFEEPGTLDAVSRLARDWFLRWL